MGLALPGPSSVVVAASIIIAALLAAPVARGHTQPPEGWQPEKPPVPAPVHNLRAHQGDGHTEPYIP